jgi:hypothetical protein
MEGIYLRRERAGWLDARAKVVSGAFKQQIEELWTRHTLIQYISSVYSHTLFLFAIAKRRNNSVKQGENEKDLTDFLKDVFSSSYSEFILNFGTEQLMAGLEL